jgi:hypothetical protein
MYTNSKALPLNFGTTIAAVYSIAATLFKCQSVVACTTKELFEMQLINGTVSNDRTKELFPSDFLGTK